MLLGLPNELVRGVLAGAGGQGVALASCCCTRLREAADQLKQQPIFCSATSTANELNEAIKDATHRAMAGSWGAVDFAMIFVANFYSPKKYTDPGDASHAVDMLKEVLGRDIPIVGCACSGLMGVGPDSTALEVDPLCRSQLGRLAAKELRQRGRQPPPTRGVSVLLGKLPAGCAARAFAATTDPEDTSGPWTEVEEALALTSSQRTQLAADLAAAAAAPVAGSSQHSQAADGSASPAMAAAASSLLSVASAAGAGDGVQVQLEPQLCLLLYRSQAHASDEMQRALDWMKARYPGMQVVGGASSGAADLLYAPGAASRLASEPTAPPVYVGLMVCSASTVAKRAIHAAAAPAAAGVAGGSTAPSASGSSMLCVAAMSAYGLEPAPDCAVYTDLAATLNRLERDYYKLTVSAAIQVPGTAKTAAPAATGNPAAGTAAGEGGNRAVADAPGGELGTSVPASLPLRRSQRVQQAAAGQAVSQASSLQLLVKEFKALEEWEVLGNVGVHLALWWCPAGSVPKAFTGEEQQLVVLGLGDCVHDESTGALELHTYIVDQDPQEEPSVTLARQSELDTKLCMQFLLHTAQGSVNAIFRGLASMKQQLQPASTAAASSSTAGAMADCYAAAAASAVSAGARSGVQALAVFSCSARGQALYCRNTDIDKVSECDPAAYGAMCEAKLVDETFKQGLPFIGVFCDDGAELDHI